MRVFLKKNLGTLLMAGDFVYSLMIFVPPLCSEEFQALYKWVILFLSSQQMVGLVQDIGNCLKLCNELHKGKECGNVVFLVS